MTKKRHILCASLTACVWVVICAALYDAGLARAFDRERLCHIANPSAVCGNAVR